MYRRSCSLDRVLYYPWFQASLGSGNIQPVDKNHYRTACIHLHTSSVLSLPFTLSFQSKWSKIEMILSLGKNIQAPFTVLATFL